MHDLINIEDLRKEFLDKIKGSEVKDFATKQQQLIEDLILRNRKLESKIKHLEAMQQSPSLLTNVTRMTPEERICIDQIEMLHSKSTERELSLDEVKRLDILVKNLRLIQGEPTKAVVPVDYTGVKEEDLVAIAASGDSGT